MTLFREDWHYLKQALKQRLFALDDRFRGWTYQEADVYLEHQINKMTIKEFENLVDLHGLSRKSCCQ